MHGAGIAQRHITVIAAGNVAPALARRLAMTRLGLDGLRSAIVAALCALLALPHGATLAQPAGPGLSPIVTFDPDRGMISRRPTKRPLTAAELKLARERAERVWEVVKASSSFSQPQGLSTFLTSWASIDEHGGLNQNYIAYWSDPRDVRRHKDGALYGVMGGAHKMLWFETNFVFGDHVLEDPATRGNFSRGVGGERHIDGVFAAPRVFGEIGGGTIYQDLIVFTRDGRSALEPAPLGPLLEGEIARLRKFVADADAGNARALAQLEASMTPQAVAERRARREARFRKDRPRADDAALARELEAAARSDEADYQRQKERLTPPPTRDPRSSYWGPRLALEAHEQRLAGLDANGRAAPACGRIDPAFEVHHQVRYDLVSAAGADCVPMVRIRRDLIDRRRPITEVQLISIWFGENRCGEWWSGASRPHPRSACNHFLPLLREIDWTAMRRALGWL
jgi:hypothetical protein